MSNPQYKWIEVTQNAQFAGRDGAGALVYKNRMYLLGGWNPYDEVLFPRRTNSEVWSSADGKQWIRETPQASWEGRHTAGYVIFHDKMWIVGGDSNKGHYQNDVWNSVDGVHWNLECDNVPWGPRALHYTLTFQDKIWVMGGQTIPQIAPADELFYCDVWNSSDGKTWQRVTDTVPWGPRGTIGGSVVLNDRMWILGGGTYDTPKRPTRDYHNDVWSSADGIEWTQHIKAAPWEARIYHDVAVFDNRMWVMEGADSVDGNRNDVWYSSDGVNWTEIPETPWAPRHAASVFVFDNALWMVAGNNMAPDVWKLIRI